MGKYFREIQVLRFQRFPDSRGFTVLSSTFGSRGQVDLIDMRTIPDDHYKWMLNDQDHFTKWVVLKPPWEEMCGRGSKYTSRNILHPWCT